MLHSVIVAVTVVVVVVFVLFVVCALQCGVFVGVTVGGHAVHASQMAYDIANTFIVCTRNA